MGAERDRADQTGLHTSHSVFKTDGTALLDSVAALKSASITACRLGTGAKPFAKNSSLQA